MEIRRLDGIAIVSCRGRIVFGGETADLRNTVKELLLHDPRVVLELSRVRTLDSGGIGILVGLYTSARNLGGDLRFAALSQRVAEVLGITRLLTVFSTYQRVEDAVASFAPQARRAAS